MHAFMLAALRFMGSSGLCQAVGLLARYSITGEER
jgi:hypothetical protein